MSYLIDRDAIYKILGPVFEPTLHKKRVLSLSLATLGILYTDRVSLAEVGRSLAGVTGKSPKHCIKQVDRLLSNDGISLDAFMGPMSAYVKWTVGERRELILVLVLRKIFRTRFGDCSRGDRRRDDGLTGLRRAHVAVAGDEPVLVVGLDPLVEGEA